MAQTRPHKSMNRGPNKGNVSGRSGVTWNAWRNRWYARITVNQRMVQLGSFVRKEDAIAAREKAEIEYRDAMAQPCPQIAQPADQSIKLVPLTQDRVAIIDADRYEWAMKWNWQIMHGYATRRGRNGEKKTIFLHRQLLNEPECVVDHINGDRLDCRLCNLRPCSQWQNISNQGPRGNQYPGVYWERIKWRAMICINGRHIHLGMFDKQDDAIAARQAAELKYRGEFAYSARHKVSPADGARKPVESVHPTTPNHRPMLAL